MVPQNEANGSIMNMEHHHQKEWNLSWCNLDRLCDENENEAMADVYEIAVASKAALNATGKVAEVYKLQKQVHKEKGKFEKNELLNRIENLRKFSTK